MSQSPSNPVSVGHIAVVGTLGGLLSGFFGVGGGIIMVPLLTFWLGLEQRRAIATSLLAIIPIAIAGLVGYAGGGSVDWTEGLVLGMGGIAGGQIGVWLLPRTPVRVLQGAFAVLLLFSAYRLVQPVLFRESVGGADVMVSGEPALWLLVVVGVASGALAGLLGVGGGVIIVPALVLLAGLDLASARGTSLLVVLMTAITASTTNIFQGRATVRIGLWAGGLGVVTAYVGSLLGQWIPEEQASVLFALLMTYAAGRMALRAFGDADSLGPEKE